ncbi:MAG: GAF domain-containing protein [Chromatiaceae bacterium]|nr:GAF domain-containing protein [Chromatiaceae bacterium]MCP5316120.1 GAF domain-containing protein [Chromatiaceae bacterium]
MSPALRSIRRCFEGAVPASIATCGADGLPNVAKLSHVQFVDDTHVALSYQFFNKTRQNILHNPRATVEVVDPLTAAHYWLSLRYQRTETEGPLFEYMKARLAAIASHSGMSKVFRLLGSDVYEVLAVNAVPGEAPAAASTDHDLLAGLRACVDACAVCHDLSRLLEVLLDGIRDHWGIAQVMLLLPDPDGRRLYTVASRGYAESGVGSELRVGEGIVGVAALAHTPIRIGHAVQEYRYSQATREHFAASAEDDALETAIPFPGLPDAGSQLAVPLLLGERLLGVLYVESREEQRFTYEDEDALVVLASHAALAMELLSRSAESLPVETPPAPKTASPPPGRPGLIRHFGADHSVFIDNDYLIKGVAGAIFWKLVGEYVQAGRTEFTNRELRLDSSLGLPDITDNLDARLILLQRRLAERRTYVSIEKTGRGRFRLNVGRPLQLRDAGD